MIQNYTFFLKVSRYRTRSGQIWRHELSVCGSPFGCRDRAIESSKPKFTQHTIKKNGGKNQWGIYELGFEFGVGKKRAKKYVVQCNTRLCRSVPHVPVVQIHTRICPFRSHSYTYLSFSSTRICRSVPQSHVSAVQFHSHTSLSFRSTRICRSVPHSVLELVSCEGGEWKIQSKNQVKEWKIQS